MVFSFIHSGSRGGFHLHPIPVRPILTSSTLSLPHIPFLYIIISFIVTRNAHLSNLNVARLCVTSHTTIFSLVPQLIVHTVAVHIMALRLDIGIVVFQSTLKTAAQPFEYGIIMRDGISPTNPTESLFMGLGAVCDVLLLVNEESRPKGTKKVQRAFYIVNSARDGKRGGPQWFGEARPPSTLGPILGIYAVKSSTQGADNRNTRNAQEDGSTRILKDQLVGAAEDIACGIMSNMSSIGWAVRSIAEVLGGLCDTRQFMPWLTPLGLVRMDKVTSLRCEYVRDFAVRIKADFEKNGRRVVDAYVAVAEELGSGETVSYVDRRVDETQVARVYLRRATPPRST